MLEGLKKATNICSKKSFSKIKKWHLQHIKQTTASKLGNEIYCIKLLN
jgi:hypothetical protein